LQHTAPEFPGQVKQVGDGLLGQAVFAQMNNRPFSFDSSGGIGMSSGGREAILNDDVFGSRPRNLIRDNSGALLSLTKGPGGAAIAGIPGTDVFLPGYRGRSFRVGNTLIRVGVNNGYLAPQESQIVVPNYYTQNSSNTVINTWTSRVIYDGMTLSYDSIDVWTGQALSLPSPQPQ